MILTENIEQNNLKLIKVNEGYVAIDLKAEILINDYFLADTLILKAEEILDCDDDDKLEIHSENYCNPYNLSNKIIFATANLNLEGVKIIEKENTSKVDDLAEKLTAKNYRETNSEFATTYYNGVIDGHEQAQKDLYTKEQVEEAIKLAKHYYVHTEFDGHFTYNNEDIFKLLNQTKVEINLTNNIARIC